MSRGSGGRGLDLKLHLSPPPPPPAPRGGERAASSDEGESSSSWSSSPSSCVSSDGERGQQGHGLQWSDSPEATSMVTTACLRCHTYVLVSEDEPRCPRCCNPVLLGIVPHGAGKNSSFNGGRGGEHSRNGGRGSRRA
ncbi:hypothetical protein ACP70R_027167 [Stipagrostis hirtigluma subsp. patula]